MVADLVANAFFLILFFLLSFSAKDGFLLPGGNNFLVITFSHSLLYSSRSAMPKSDSTLYWVLFVLTFIKAERQHLVRARLVCRNKPEKRRLQSRSTTAGLIFLVNWEDKSKHMVY